MLGNWRIRADAPGNNLYVAISVQHPTLGNYFTAALQAKLVGQTSDSVKLATFFWLMPHKVAAGIYWEVAFQYMMLLFYYHAYIYDFILVYNAILIESAFNTFQIDLTITFLSSCCVILNFLSWWGNWITRCADNGD
jgi:hypothetical protein